ncbi:hypothetical protein [Spirulina major]|uniref:hypothetical protein n=1 Tax=Spirulina major TaxID=270636 RepID=UPI000934F1D3|nr:hypothetical protein [Spirulina major]
MPSHDQISRKLSQYFPTSKQTAQRRAIAPPATTLPPGALMNNVQQVTTPIQPKLTVGAVGDKYEQEADRVAADVVQELHAPATQRQAIDTPFSHVAQRTTVQRKSTPPTIQRNPSLLEMMMGSASAMAAPVPVFSVKNPGLSAQTVKDNVTAAVNAKPFITELASSPWTWADLGFELERIYCAESWHFINAVGEYQKNPNRSNFLGIMEDFIKSSGSKALNIASSDRHSYIDKAAAMEASGELDSPAANHFNDALVLQDHEILKRSIDAYRQQISSLS